MGCQLFELRVAGRLRLRSCALQRALVLREVARVLARLQHRMQLLKAEQERVEAEFERARNMLRDRRTALRVKLQMVVAGVDAGVMLGDVRVKRVAIRIRRLRLCKTLVVDGTVVVQEPGPTTYLAADTKRTNVLRAHKTIAAMHRAGQPLRRLRNMSVVTELPTFNAWEIIARDEDGRPARLLEAAPLTVHGLRMHVEAWRVERARMFGTVVDGIVDAESVLCSDCMTGDEAQVRVECAEQDVVCVRCGHEVADTTQVHPYCDDDLQMLWRVFSNGDGDFETTALPGFEGEWILLVTPCVN